MAPTLFTSCNALPPEGAAPPAARRSRFRGLDLHWPAPFASIGALPPEGAVLAWGGPAQSSVTPTLFTLCNALPPEGAVLAWGGPARRTFFLQKQVGSI